MFSKLAQDIFKHKYAFTPTETWDQLCVRVVTNVLAAYPALDRLSTSDVDILIKAMQDRKLIPAGRYLYAAGRPFHQTQNCMALDVEDSREGWSDLMYKASMALMTGAGVGIDYSKIRARGCPISKTGGTASGPVSLMYIINDMARQIQQGGSRRSALLAQLNWYHPDIGEFIRAKNWSDDIKAMKAKDFNFPAPLDGTNISVRIGDKFFESFERGDPLTVNLFNDVTYQMCSTGEPGFIVNQKDQAKQYHTNACSEARFDLPDNVCNLGSINMAKVKSKAEFEELVRLGSLFLYAGTFYSDLPYDDVYKVRNETRQIGLGLMGVHEWFIQRGLKYGEITPEFDELMQIYATNLELLKPYVVDTAPVYGRAIAPTGTLSILAETTGGIEPIFSVAYKRRYLKGTIWHHQYNIEAIALKLINEGVVKENELEDAYSIDYERRIAFQAYMQKFVDQAISSTVNLPSWGSEGNNESTLTEFRRVLKKYLSQLRGITTYPDGSRGGQPLTPVKLSTALKYTGQELLETSNNICDITGGSCGS
jgi:ribonucleoside-diphosphate reductase alpha chain